MKQFISGLVVALCVVGVGYSFDGEPVVVHFDGKGIYKTNVFYILEESEYQVDGLCRYVYQNEEKDIWVTEEEFLSGDCADKLYMTN